MTETKLHYKLYKTKHGWVTATIAATALAIPVIGGSVTNHASADTTATTGTQTVTSGSNAVTATTASTTSVTPSNQAVTPDSSKLDQAVQNAKATANVTVNQTPTQTVTGSTVAEAKQKAEQDYQNQATQINQKVANQKANNDATNAANSFNIDNSKKRELDQAVQNAKATANVSVKQTQTQIYNTGVSGVENTKNKINNDYSTQINNINQAVSTQKAKNDAYNKAVAEANTLNSTADTTRKKLDDAIKAAQAVKGVTVIDGGTTTATVSVSDFEAKKKQIQDQNTQQANSINAQIQQYKKEYTKYEKEYNDYLASLKNKSTIESNVVWQNLFLNFGQGANLSVQWNAKPIETHQNQDPDAVVTLKKNLEYNAVFKGSQKGTVATATWLMPEGSAYYKSLDGTKETRIAKIVSVISNVVASGDNSNRVIIGFYNNPMIHAFSSFANSVDETFYFYDDTGKLIDFKDGTAWLGLASLNHFGAPRDIKEEVKALSGAKIYTPVGNVTVGPELHVPAYDLGDGVFGDKGNNWASYAIARVTNGATLRWIKYGANNSGDFHWDESKKTYLNADGTVPFTGAGNDVNAWYQWAMSTDLYGKEKNLNPPTPPTIHYRHTNVALEKPTPIDVTYHYDRMNPASIEDRTDISYHYNKISVPIPNPTKKADKEGKTLIAGDESTQHISQYTGVNQKLDKFAVGDAIQYTNDGRLPVSFDLSKWTVTTSNGTNVTAQGKFAQYDKTFEGKKYHVVSWSPTNVSSLKDNETYTLNTILKTLNDGITDGEIDRAVGGGDGVTFGEAHGYDEFNPTTDKAWKEGSQTVNGKIEINEDIAHAKVTMTMPDPAKLANKLSNVAITDNYSKFANLVTVTGANVYENERNATSDYTIVNNNKVVTATRKNPATANGGTVSLVVDFKVNPDVPSGTKLVNSGSGTINTQTVPTPDAQIVTFTQKPTKHWIEGSQVVDGKTYINNDIVTTQVDMNLPDPKQLAKTLSYVSIGDNYRDFADKTVLQSYKVFENGTNVTSQYTITNQDGILQAVRKNAATTPGGKVSLIATFAINHDVKSGTKLTNRGFGRINNHTVDTNTPQIVTFKQDTSKHWVEGSQVVDDKTYINEDMVHGQVTMTLPNKDSLAKALTDVTLVDDYSDYANKVSYVNAQVFENNTDVTSQYNITNAGNKITATRKNPGATPSGSVRLVANFKLNSNLPSGTKLINRGSGRINNNTVNTNEAKILTYVQSTDKHWVEGSQKVDGKTYIDGDTIHGQVTMTLPDKNTLAKALSTVQVIDDYSKFAKMVDYKSAQVLENGKDVTSEYNISNAYGQVVATRKNATATPSGNVTLNVTWAIHKDVPSGTQLVNSGSGRINSHTVPTPDRNIVTYKQDGLKDWINSQGQIVNGKTYIDNDTVHAKLVMTLPDPKALATPLTKVQLDDNYTNFAKLVDYQSAQVLENGKDVTSLYTITNSNGHVTATRKDASTTPAGKVTLNVHWRIHKDVKSGTQLVNSGNGRINDETVPTPNRNIVTFKQDGLKDWLNSQNQVVNGKTYIDNDTVHAKLAMNLPDPKALATPLTKVQLDDNYSNFAKLVDYVSSQVLENGTDVTSQYNIVNNNGHVIATRKDASKTPGGKVEFKVNFKIHTDVPSGTTLMNSGEVTLNTETIPTPTPNIVTYKPNTDKHWVEGTQVVDGKTYIDNDFVHSQVTMTLPDPTKLAEKLKHVSVTDDYSRFAKMIDYKSAQVLENGKDVTAQYNITNANGKVVATRKDASTTPNGSVTLNVTWRIHTDVKSGTVFVNGGDGRINDETVLTPDRNIVTYKQDTLKNWINSQGQIVNDKTVIDRDIVHGQVEMTLPDPTKLANKLSKVEVVDDYSNFAAKVIYTSARVLENGKDVTSLYTITNANDKVTATRKDPAATPGGKVVLITNLQVHSDVKSGTELVNKGYGTLNTETIETNTPKIVTFRQDTDKHWVEGSQVVDGKTYIDGDNVSAQISMTLPDPNKLAEKLKNVVVVDDYSKFADKVDYKSAKVLENGKDVTSQYDIKVAKQGFVIASRKDPSITPGGKVVLQVFWKVYNDIESGTQLVNSGNGTINDETVPTPDRTIVTYKQDTEKHWRDDGGQIVDGKIAINDDVVTARVDMTLPKEENLAKPLDKIQLVDDFSKFANKVTLQAVHVYENGKDVTDQYDIHIENGRVVATRKDASKVYDHTGAANATMKATLKANKTLNVNDLVHTASANVNDSKVFAVNRLAFNRLFARSFITSNLAVTSDDNIKSQIDMAVPTNVDAKTPMTVTSDYSNFAKYVNVKDATVYENGKNVTADYTIKDDKAGHVTAIKKDSSESDGGQVSLVVDYEVNHGIPNGTILENHGSGTLNGQDVPTNTPSITTYTQDTNKHWVEGDQNVDGKIYVNGSTAHAQVSMTLPDQSKLINKLLNVSIDDDYSKFAKLVDYKSAKVLENDKDVTSEYTIKNTNDHVTAVRKDASKTPAGNVQLLVDFEIHKDVKSGTELVNGGSGTLNKNTVPTNTPSIWTYTPDGEKHWVLDNNVTDNKIYFSGDKAVAQVSVDLPDASKLATPLNKLVLVDNYSDFADKVKLDSAKVLENGKDVTSEYDLTNKDGKVVATRKDAAKTPSGKAVLVTTFTINNGIENATALHNKGSVTFDSITDEVPDTPIVVFTPKAHKDVELGGDVKGDTENSVDGSLILNGSVVTYPITTSDLPAERAEDITKRVVKDTLDKNAEFVGFKAWIENDKGELEDVTSHYKLDKNGQDLTFTEDSYLLGLYNKDKSKQTHTPIIDLVVKAKGDAQKITNKATVLTNDNVTETNEVSVDTPAKPTPTKVDKNEKGVNIDGKNVLPGSVNNYELTMDLAKFKGIKVTDQDLAKGFYFVDDYPEEALDVDPQTFTYKTVDGKTVKGLSAKVYQSLSEVPENVATALKANGITPSGAFVLISADTPAQFFKDYVETGTNIIVNAPMKVKEGFAGKYQNKAWQLIFGQGEATDIVSNNVPKIDPKKDIVISADNRTSLNNHTIELGQNFDYLLKGGILDKDQGHDIYEYKWIDDYDENHDQYNGQFIAPLTVDVTLKDGTVLKAGTDISNHVSQNIDTKTGSVEFSVDKDFLDKVDFDKSGFAADILMSVKRIKAGEVDNTYTNIINGQKFGSNTVHSTTPEPKEPETPATPKTPETPSVPVAQTQTPATPQPVKMVTSTPAPKTPELPALPQTGEANDTLAEEVVGFAAIVAALGMAGTSLKKRED
ncbi:SspB-related isopeptide-forming adhesin [Ligilactobacillus salivarius]|uniref:SspB-related isopeptide-forming adhesin n=1 Tax=Ligilactobacillus salivarius TaxID=1624 RepID=UPI0015577F02|nr:SspB-related isopeptide-forming adhesin [Ligilactobacillus salivarius]